MANFLMSHLFRLLRIFGAQIFAIVIFSRPTLAGDTSIFFQSEKYPLSIEQWMAGEGVKELTLTATQTTATRLSAQAAWVKRVIYPQCQQNLANTSNAEATLKLAEQTLSSIYLHRFSNEGDPALLNAGAALLKSGVHDAFILYLAAQAHLLNNEMGTARELGAKARAEFRKSKYSKLLGALLYLQKAEIFHDKLGISDELRDGHLKACGYLVEALAEPKTVGPENVISYLFLVDTAANEHVVRDKMDGFKPVFEGKGLPEWAQETLKGMWEENVAWNARGGDYAYAVKDDGWKIFQTHLPLAMDHYRKAWQLEPRSPLAPYEAIYVTTSGGGGMGDTAELWLERCLKAELDFGLAFSSYFSGNRPRWGGRLEKIVAMGFACLQTKRFDTELPSFLLNAMETVTNEADSISGKRAIWKSPLLGVALMQMCEGYVAAARNPNQREYWLSCQLFYGCLSGQYKSASEAMQKLQGKFHPAINVLASRLGYDAVDLRAEALIGTLGDPSPMQSIRILRRDGKIAEARSMVEKFGKIGGTPIAPWAERQLRLMAVEEKLGKGEWVSYLPDRHIEDWEAHSGKWSFDSAGNLVVAGEDGQARISHKSFVGDYFEAKAVFEVISPEKSWQNAGICFGNINGLWFYAGTFQVQKGPVFASLLCRYRSFSIPVEKLTPPTVNPCRVHLIFEGRKVSLEVNGKQYFSQLPMLESKNGTDYYAVPSALIGFAGNYFSRLNQVSFKSLEVRRLPKK